MERSIPEEDGFAARAAEIERLEIHVLEREGAPEELKARARALRRRLVKQNVRVVRDLRRRIRSRTLAPAELRRELEEIAGPSADALELLVGGLMRAGPLGVERLAREPEMVFYQPTPARAILELVDRAGLGPGEVLVDLGSGLGHVVILAALLSGARAQGIEREPAYCDYARRCARRLNVSGVELIEADAREAPLGEGTVFFLYTPFRGALLRQVVERLEAEADRRPIRVCTYGPCTAEVARTPWLIQADERPIRDDDVATFHRK